MRKTVGGRWDVVSGISLHNFCEAGTDIKIVIRNREDVAAL